MIEVTTIHGLALISAWSIASVEEASDGNGCTIEIKYSRKRFEVIDSYASVANQIDKVFSKWKEPPK